MLEEDNKEKEYPYGNKKIAKKKDQKNLIDKNSDNKSRKNRLLGYTL